MVKCSYQTTGVDQIDKMIINVIIWIACIQSCSRRSDCVEDPYAAFLFFLIFRTLGGHQSKRTPWEIEARHKCPTLLLMSNIITNVQHY